MVIQPLNGFSGSVQLTLSGLPAGVSFTPQTATATTASGVSFQLTASVVAPVGTNSVTVTGTSGSITHSSTFPLSITSAASFAIQVNPSTISMAPGSKATVQVTMTSKVSPAPQVFLNESSFPGQAEINTSTSSGIITPTSPTTLTLTALPLAQPLQNFPLVVTANDVSGNTSIATVNLTVSVPFPTSAPPTRSSFVRTDQSVTGIVYDQARKLLFVSVEILNEVLVLSSVDGHQVASIPVVYPTGIDEAVDGSAVYVVSPFIGNVTIIDPNLLQVIGRANVPKSVSNTDTPLAFFRVATLANGKVMLFLAWRDELANFWPFYLWDPGTNTFSTVTPPGANFSNLSAFFAGIQRSGDHKTVMVQSSVGPTTWLYDVSTETFVLQSTNVLSGAVINYDGTKFAVNDFENAQTVFYNRQLNVIGTTPFYAFPYVGITFSRDGKHAYLIEEQDTGQADLVIAVNTETLAVEGLVSGPTFGASIPFSGQAQPTFIADETSMLFGSTPRGVAFLDLSVATALKTPIPSPFRLGSALVSQISPTQIQLNGAGFDQNSTFKLNVGAPPSNPNSLFATGLSVQSSNVINAIVPQGTVPGPANLTLTRSDGFSEVMPDAVTFGPTILKVDADSGSTVGGDPIQLVGYGISGPGIQVTIGGRTAPILQQKGNLSDTGLPTEVITLQTPSGSVGPAEVSVTSPAGTTTLPNGFHYADAVNVYPMAGALDAIVYDFSRQRLYITNEDHNRVEVFSLNTNTFLPAVSVGKSPTSLSITPDKQFLAVTNSADGTVSVIDLNTMLPKATYPVLTSADQMPFSCAGVAQSLVAVSGHRALVNVNCTYLLGQGVFHMLNLDTGSLHCAGITTCQPNGTDLQIGTGLGNMATVPDGSKVFMVSSGAGGDALVLLDLTANTITNGYPTSALDPSVSADGLLFGGGFGIANLNMQRAYIMAYELYADSGAQSIHNRFGNKLSPSGSLLYSPQDSGVDIFDVRTGRLTRHLVVPDPIPADTNSLSIDETGTKMFLISTTGITIAQISDMPLSLARATPSSGGTGTVITLRGSGFVQGTKIKIGNTTAPTTFVDVNTLTTTLPVLPAGPVRITLTNPDNQQYSVDDAIIVQ